MTPATTRRTDRKPKPARPPKAELREARLGPPWVRRLAGIQALGVGPAVARQYGRFFDWKTRRGFARTNAPARQAFRTHPVSLDASQQRLLDALRRDGLARIPLQDLAPDVDFAALVRAAEDWMATPEAEARAQSYLSGDARKWKDYIVRHYGRDAAVPWSSPWLQLGLHPRLLDVVNAYHGLWSKLTYVDVWNTLPLEHDGPDMGSQRWHRDPEDSQLVKAFLYLNDVADDAGPMEYVPRSRRGDAYGHLWPQVFPGGSVPPEGELEKVIPESDRVRCTGPAGTLLLVDTTGFHRGGRATHHRRVLATWTFATPASVWPRAFSVTDQPPVSPDTAAGFAIQ